MWAAAKLLAELRASGWTIAPLVHRSGKVGGLVAKCPATGATLCHLPGYEVRDGVELCWQTFGGDESAVRAFVAEHHLEPAWHRAWHDNYLAWVLPTT